MGAYKYEGPIVMKAKSKYIVFLQGGIGNQLFQYAYAEYLNKVDNKPVAVYFYSKGDKYNRENIIKYLHPSVPLLGSSILDRFILRNIERPKNIITKLARKLSFIYGIRFSNERQKDNFHQYYKGLDNRGITMVRGYWQSAEMVNLVQEGLVKVIGKFSIESEEYSDISHKMSNYANPVAIHIRDFSTSINHTQQTISESYYKKAIDKILSSNKDAFFFVFASDNKYAKGIIADSLSENNYLLVPNSDNPRKDLEALILMSQCKYFILSNSTFGWWGAWFSWAKQKNEDSVFYMPDRWDMSKDAKNISESFRFSDQCVLIAD